MRLSPQARIDLTKVATITVAYLVFTLFLAFYDHVMIISTTDGQPPARYNLALNVALHLLSGLVAGLLGGSLLVRNNKRIFRRYSLGRALLATLLLYVSVYIVVSVLISTLTGYARIEGSPTLKAIAAGAWTNLSQPAQIIYFVMWGFITVLTLFLLQVHDKFGPGVLRKFLLGQYFHPREEYRLFMFIDMRSSTAIAERIGDEPFFRLLRECYAIMTGPIMDSGGEICQYIGDEVVISWKPSVGFEDANCLQCFVEVRKRLAQAATKFEQEFGLVPEFKAGLHYGSVVAGEIGEIKKDIVYSGDVLNATSRIQGLCNIYKEDLLASSDVIDMMAPHARFAFKPIGELELRGKEKRLIVQAVQSVQPAQPASA